MVNTLQPQKPIKPEEILEIIVRRKWLIILPVCCFLTLGVVLTLTAPKTYQASTLILVQQQSVPSEYVRSVVTSSINQRISTISQQILSRSNLEKIIGQFNLYADKPDMYLEDKIEDMRQRVQVKIEQARGGTEAFSIRFSGRDPHRVMQIANTLASYFMDENLKVREAQAVGTSEFLEQELEKTRQRLEEMETRLSTYRAAHIGGLPDELDSNLRTLDRLQQQMADKHVILRETKTSLALVESRISEIETRSRQPFQNGADTPATGSGVMGTENQEKLSQARQEYDRLLTVYTPRHPDVKRLLKTIENLEQQVAEENERSSEIKDPGQSAPVPDSYDPQLARLRSEQDQLEKEIQALTMELDGIEKKMKAYQKRVEQTPRREMELQSLNRDYANIKEVYNSLLNRKLEAELSVNMEKRQKGEQFRILDSAKLPEKPVSPDVKKYFFLSVVAGFGLAAGIIFLLEFFDSSIRQDEQIEEDLGLAILADIPELQSPGTTTRNRVEMAAFASCCLYAAAFLSFFAVLYVKGLDRTLDAIKTMLHV
ncbi:MAG: protein GumC [Desulfotignum sp.]|nr:protein GumC [Desulfotignum sp.]MCF8088147.1 protein GumC [Desulfotignum sp.]MCF8135793.1 protein GumC [Desulfotignum sp.]